MDYNIYIGALELIIYCFPVLLFRVKNHICRYDSIWIVDENSFPVVFLEHHRQFRWWVHWYVAHRVGTSPSLWQDHVTCDHYSIRRGCAWRRKSISQGRVQVRIDAFSISIMPYIDLFNSILGLTHLPVFCGTPNANALNEVFTMLHMPHAW